ncbi:related to 26S proteasome non-ATPase regulatory subunit 9 [Melanopsichium pennsylvanicum]|uniref:Probable 26S proteasome regulatory subunit p27 n=2 Tax=Melanopsichium pennsylvanicum TaxID=63383 RepID=A0AAJ4XNL8_9BASI|nr:related to 26S proteasome non-ATPase regulatory subunit 9 [Melanopsichium pennsylvanicum 4]SNX85443.1 related to 26S proteasome non-ATPase regulatory subunit 9 [Melanopsichium pennsylvanicum]
MSTDLNIDIHNTTFYDVDVSSALSHPIPTKPVAAREEAMCLLELQKQLDADISRHMTVLTSNDIDMHTLLVDAQGFPLANKDLMAIRTARQRINILRNDSKAVRERVSKLLELAINGDEVSVTPANSSAARRAAEFKAFARVNSVAENSPAKTAGLQAGDEILSFGSVTANEPNGLGALAAPGVVVDGSRIQLLVKRDGAAENVALTLVPRADWGGRGLLGCHLLPL